MPEGRPATARIDSDPDGPAIGPAIRRAALAVAVARYVIPLLALPLIPVLLPDRTALLILLRPTRELLLVAGAQLRVTGEPELWLLFAAFVPLMMVAVWAFFVVGRAYRGPLRDGDGPRWLHRVMPADQLEQAQRVLARRGPTIAVLGRVAGFPPTLLAAAAGVSDVAARRYLAADSVGAVLAFAIAVGAGYTLGQAYERGGVWLTAGGLALILILVVLLSRWVRREATRGEGLPPAVEG